MLMTYGAFTMHFKHVNIQLGAFSPPVIHLQYILKRTKLKLLLVLLLIIIKVIVHHYQQYHHHCLLVLAWAKKLHAGNSPNKKNHCHTKNDKQIEMDSPQIEKAKSNLLRFLFLCFFIRFCSLQDRLCLSHPWTRCSLPLHLPGWPPLL